MPFGGVKSNDIIQISKVEYDKEDNLYKIEFKLKGEIYDMYGIYGLIGDIEFLNEQGVKFQYEDKFYKIPRNVIAFRKIMEDKLYFFYVLEKYTSNLFIGKQN